MGLFVTVDKLLTGFDPPPCIYRHIDKSIHELGRHQLLLACRQGHCDDAEPRDSQTRSLNAWPSK
jgi:type I restriction enzyme, R subunit